MDPCRLGVFITVLLALFSLSGAAIIREPTPQIIFEGQVSEFSCHSNATLFWQINGQLFDQSQLEKLQSLGFIFNDSYSDGSVTRRISVVGSRETNNTVITCLSVDNENEVTISGNATLTVIGSPSNVVLDSSNASVFKLTWAAPLTPTSLQPHNYTVIVQYTSSSTQPHTETSTIPVSNETDVYMFEYPVTEPPSTCSQFIFSVFSTNSLGDSEPVTVSWEKPQDPGPLEITQCLLKFNDDDSMTALVRFTFPELCHFQKANYSFSLSSADTNSQPVASSDTRSFVGGGDRDIRGQLHNLKLDLKNVYKVRVNTELLGNGGRIAGPAFDCSISEFTPPSVGSLESSDTGDRSTPEVIAGIVIGAVLLVTVLLVNGIMLLVVCIKKPRSQK